MNLPRRRSALAVGLLLAIRTDIRAQDPNFHIYLAFGQSNMEGQAPPEAQDRVPSSRFRVLSPVSCSSPARTKDVWAPAVAPIVRCYTNLSPLDYFGRTLVDSLPAGITIGVVPVAVAGSKIEGFDLSTYKAYYETQPAWMQATVAEYGGNPYARLVELAREAQKTGVIKGILLHQGESNVGDPQWATKVKAIYASLLSDLGLDPKQVPLLAGEVAPAGLCAAANSMIDALPRTIPTAHVVSAKDLVVGTADWGMGVHFDAPSTRELGRRYALAMLSILHDSGTGIVDTTWRDTTTRSKDSVVFTTFDMPYGQNPRQTDLAVRLEKPEGGWWTAFHDDSGSTISNGAGQEVTTDTAAFSAAVSGGALHLRMTTSTSSMQYPYAAVEANFTAPKSWFDLRRLSKLVLRIRGSVSGGALRVYFTTRDVQVAGDWGNYGVFTDLENGWTILDIPALDLAPTPWSAAATGNWTWSDSGASHVDGIGFSVGSGADADLWIDDITLLGLDSTVFKASSVAIPPRAAVGNPIEIRHRADLVQVAYRMESAGRVEARLVDPQGRTLAKLESEGGPGVRNMELPLSSRRGAILFLHSEGASTTRWVSPSR